MILLQDTILTFDDPEPPEKPTKARPGTRAKVREMMERLKRGEALFHPSDAPYDPSKVTLGFTAIPGGNI